MNILATVGSTPFDSLFLAIDSKLDPQEFKVDCQIAKGTFTPTKHHYFRFTDDIEHRYFEADIIITHAGAGTVFDLLEKQKKMVVVPNADRIDSHQLELAKYLEDNNFAVVCYDMDNLEAAIHQATVSEFEVYQRDEFNRYELIADTLFSASRQLKQPTVAGIPVSTYGSLEQVLADIVDGDGNLTAGTGASISPETIIQTMQNKAFFDAIAGATLRFPDGIGVAKTLSRKVKRKVTRIPGCELWEMLMEKAGIYHLPVYLVGAHPDVIAKTKKQLIGQYGVDVVGAQNGYFKPEQEQAIIDKIVEQQPAIVSVALGQPRQELFIAKCRDLCPNTFFMGVGGTYDVYTGAVKRAPKIYRQLNLEWFYRLASEPRRAFRQVNLIKYAWLELKRAL